MDLKEALSIKGASVRILIQENTPMGQYNDCLFYSEAELESMTADDVAAAAKARSDAWQAFVTEQSSKPPVPPKPEDLKEQAEQLKLQWAQMVTALASVGTKADLQLIQDKLDEAVTVTATAVDAKPVDAVPIEEEPLIP